jgi:hypothetical protein
VSSVTINTEVVQGRQQTMSLDGPWQQIRVTTLQDIIATMEGRYGKADRIWVVDRGMVSQDNVEFLQAGHRRYIIGTPKSLLKPFGRQLMEDDWQRIQEELEVKFCPSHDGQEVLPRPF